MNKKAKLHDVTGIKSTIEQSKSLKNVERHLVYLVLMDGSVKGKKNINLLCDWGEMHIGTESVGLNTLAPLF